MKICLIVPKLLPVPCVKGGAIERLVTDIIDQNEIEKKLEITVVSIYDKEAEEASKKYKSTKFIYVKNDFKYKLKALYIRLMKVFGIELNTYNEVVLDKIKKEEFDFIVVEDGAYEKFKTYLKYFDKSKMLLHFHHDGKSDSVTDETFSTYIGISKYVANTFRNSSKIKNIEVLLNGINIERFDKRASEKELLELRQNLGFDKDDYVVVFCGRLIKEKGVMELIKAIKLIDNDNIKLMIVGSINFAKNGNSEYLINLKEEIENSNNRIKMTGYIDNKDLYKYYQSADVGIVPSIWDEGAALVNIEIMISKIPLIATKVGGIPEYASEETAFIERNENIIYSIKDAILGLYNDKKIGQEMVEKSYTHAKKYSTEVFYNNFVEILNRRAGKK